MVGNYKIIQYYMTNEYLDKIKILNNDKINCCSTSNFDEKYILAYPKMSRLGKVSLLANYPEFRNFGIEKLICKKFNLSSIILGSGSEDLIVKINYIAERNNWKVGFITPIFHRIIESFLGNDRKFIPAGKIFKYNYEKFDIVWMTNPNLFNGETHKKDDLIKLFKRYPRTIFIVDEAGIFTLVDWKKFTLLAQNRSIKNVVVLESFSKMFGLAGLRAGFATGNKKIISELRKNGNTFPFSSLTEYFLKFLLNKEAFINEIRNRIHNHKREIEDLLGRDRDVIIKKNLTNCIFLKFKKKSKRYRYLLGRKIYFLDLNFKDNPEKRSGYIRITIHSSKKLHDKVKSELIKILNLRNVKKRF